MSQILELHGPSMLFMECSINSPALSLLMKHLIIGQRLKTPNFSAFHWSPRGSLVSIGQHFVATRVVYLPKSTETSLITESDQSGPNHQLSQLCTARTACGPCIAVIAGFYRNGYKHLRKPRLLCPLCSLRTERNTAELQWLEH